MKKIDFNVFVALLLASTLALLSTTRSYAQTITFDDQGYVHNAGIGHSIMVGNFTFSLTDMNLVVHPDSNEQMYYESSSAGNGFAGSGLIYVGDQFNFDDPYYFRIQVNDGSNRRLSSFYIYDYINGAGKDKISITVEGFRDNVEIGEQDFNLIDDGISKQVLSLDPSIFGDVDEVRIRQFQPFAFGPQFPGVVFAFDQFVFENALPVRLIAFEAARAENGIDLSWQTATETASAYFDIERSTDARNWERIGRLNAKGESDRLVHYGFRDKGSVSDERYYRLKMVDTDSSFAYSKICHVAAANTRNDIVLYPNPATTAVTLRASEAAISSVELLNDAGRSVKRFQPSVPVTTEMNLPLNNIPPGIYLLRMKTGNGTFEIKKLVKAR